MTGSTGLNLRIEPELAKAMRRLRALPAHERAYAATNVLAELEGAGELLRSIRSAAIDGLRGDGLSYAEIGELLDVNRETARKWHHAAASPAAPAEA